MDRINLKKLFDNGIQNRHATHELTFSYTNNQRLRVLDDNQEQLFATHKLSFLYLMYSNACIKCFKKKLRLHLLFKTSFIKKVKLLILLSPSYGL